jgi:hypothetical protein
MSPLFFLGFSHVPHHYGLAGDTCKRKKVVLVVKLWSVEMTTYVTIPI